MSNQVNTDLIEWAIELVDECNDPRYYKKLERLVLKSDLDGIRKLIRVLLKARNAKGPTRREIDLA